MLTAYIGERKAVNRKLLLESFNLTPSLILDCGNAADVHALFPKITEEQLNNVYVINLEAIYRFRKGLQITPYWINKLGLKQIIITTISVLFSYDDEVENHNIITHCWELMKEISKNTPVKVGVTEDKFTNFADKIVLVKKKELGYYHTPSYMKDGPYKPKPKNSNRLNS